MCSHLITSSLRRGEAGQGLKMASLQLKWVAVEDCFVWSETKGVALESRNQKLEARSMF